MASLIINGMEKEVVLQPGTLRVGRTDSNDLRINDPSVSSRHCLLIYEDGILKVKDLGSTNGTYVNGIQVEEAVVEPNTDFKIGSVEVRFGDESVEAEVQSQDVPSESEMVETDESIPAMSPGRRDLSVCSRHPQSKSKWICQKCGTAWCDTCVEKRLIGMQKIIFCPVCKGFCDGVEAYRDSQIRNNTSFSGHLAYAFKYPLKGDGPGMIIAGSLVYSVFEYLQVIGTQMILLSMLGLFAMVFFVFCTGYVVSFLKSVVMTSASGETKLPEWPDLSNFHDDIQMPLIQYIAIMVACFCPALILGLLHYKILAIVACVLGVFVLPMAFLGVSIADGLAGLNPLVIIPSIFKVFGPYCVVCLISLGIFLMSLLGEYVMDFFPLRFIAILLVSLFEFYLLCVEMRILGILYLTRKEKLGWI